MLALGAYTYTPALMPNVLLALLVVLLFARHVRRRDVAGLVAAGVVGAIVLIPYFIALTDPLFTQRTGNISVFHGGVNVSAISMAWNHYWAQWDPTYLYLRGTTNLRNEPGMGVLLPLAAPFLLIGIIAGVVRRRGADLFVLGWLVLGPLAAALTNDGVPHFLRGIYALPAIILAIARGCAVAWDWIGRRSLARPAIRVAAAAALALVLAAQMVVSYSFYFNDYPVISMVAWHYGEAASLAMVRDTVPAGGVACLDPGALSYWTFPQLVAWYLPSSPFTVVEGLNDPRCSRAGAYLLAHPNEPDGRREPVPPPQVAAALKLPVGAASVASVPGSGSPFILWRIEP